MTVFLSALLLAVTPSQNLFPVKDWISKNAIPLKWVEAGAGFDDLAPLKKTFANVPYVGLGEATHGSREFFTFKHRMLEFLVKEMGFRLFLMEASYPGCEKINEFVVEGKGDAKTALAAQGFYVWDTEEILGMIQWLHDYNKSVSTDRRVRFAGYDLQVLTLAPEYIEAYFRKVAPDLVDGVRERARSIMEVYSQAKPEEFRAAEEKVRGIEELFVKNRDAFVAKSSVKEYDRALMHVQVALQVFQSRKGGTRFEGKDPRDYFLAKNVESILKQESPGTKAVIWAHNAHISASTEGNGMGVFLRRAFGPKYYALGFEFSEGGFQSLNSDPQGGYGLTEFVLPPAADDSAAGLLRSVGIPRFFIDFRANPPKPVVDWLSTPVAHRDQIGSSFGKSRIEEKPAKPGAMGAWMHTVRLGEWYDGMVFFDKVGRARPVRR